MSIKKIKPVPEPTYVNKAEGWSFNYAFLAELALESKTFNDLATRTSTPGTTAAFLIVLCLPKKAVEWMSLDEEQLILRKCGYWYRVTTPPTPNTDSIRIRIPRVQLFGPDALQQLFTALRQEALP